MPFQWGILTLARSSTFWAGSVENWPGRVEFCIEHIRDICFLGECPQNLISHTAFQALCIISAPSVNSNRSYDPDILNSGQIVDFSACLTLKYDWWPFYASPNLWPLTLIFGRGMTFVNGNNSWIFHDDTRTGTVKRCDRCMDRQTGQVMELHGCS